MQSRYLVLLGDISYLALITFLDGSIVVIKDGYIPFVLLILGNYESFLVSTFQNPSVNRCGIFGNSEFSLLNSLSLLDFNSAVI